MNNKHTLLVAVLTLAIAIVLAITCLPGQAVEAQGLREAWQVAGSDCPDSIPVCVKNDELVVFVDNKPEVYVNNFPLLFAETFIQSADVAPGETAALSAQSPFGRLTSLTIQNDPDRLVPPNEFSVISFVFEDEPADVRLRTVGYQTTNITIPSGDQAVLGAGRTSAFFATNVAHAGAPSVHVTATWSEPLLLDSDCEIIVCIPPDQ